MATVSVSDRGSAITASMVNVDSGRISHFAACASAQRPIRIVRDFSHQDRRALGEGAHAWHAPDVAALRADAQRLLAECRTHNRDAALLRDQVRARLVVVDALAVARRQRLAPVRAAGRSGPTALALSPRPGAGQPWSRLPVVARVPIRQTA
jgi:hypothetical protein